MTSTHTFNTEREPAIPNSGGAELYGLMARAGRIREEHKGNRAALCGILNAKSGRCSENCAFCSQSAHHAARAPVFKLVPAAAMVARAREVESMGARAFSIVASGTAMRSGREIDEICRALERLSGESRLMRCASLGNLSAPALVRLQNAGLQRYHHNLETARSFFRRVCTTHDYEEDVATVRRAADLGLSVCSGGIFGLGESWEQRAELAETLKELDVDAVPLNFLHPIPGTPLEGRRDLTPLLCLEIIARFRLLMPEKDIYVCGGREINLRELQSWIFMAGANGMMIGDYLTTSGRDYRIDLQMLRDLKMIPIGCGGAP